MGTTIDLDAVSGNAYYLGYFATELALNTAHPVGVAGEYAIVGDTDTIWAWDVSANIWIDSSTPSTADVRIFKSGDIIYLQTKIGGVWTNTGTEWEV